MGKTWEILGTNSNLEMAKLLILKSVKLETRNEIGRTPLEVAEEMEYTEIVKFFDFNHYYTNTYAESRSKFRAILNSVQRVWSEASLTSYAIGAVEEDLTIDMIKTDPLSDKKRLVILSSGLHGIEGYIGAAIIQLFVHEILSALNPDDTGLILVHAINPWGMLHHRRVNENNVDLNRNFIFKQDKPPERINPAYDRAALIFNPVAPLRSVKNPLLLLQLISKMLSMGPARFWEAFRFGQYRHLRGLSYGGKNF